MAATMSEWKRNSAVCSSFLRLSQCFVNSVRVYFVVVLLLALTERSRGNDEYERVEFLKREYSLSKPYQGG